MHLKYDRPFNLMIFFTSFGFVALFIGFLLMDTEQYQPAIEARQQALKPASPMPPPAPMVVPEGHAPGAAPTNPTPDQPAAPAAATAPAPPASAPKGDASAPK
jgi:hypothetical protein